LPAPMPRMTLFALRLREPLPCARMRPIVPPTIAPEAALESRVTGSALRTTPNCTLVLCPARGCAAHAARLDRAAKKTSGGTECTIVVLPDASHPGTPTACAAARRRENW